jgi:hypothetical protein
LLSLYIKKMLKSRKNQDSTIIDNTSIYIGTRVATVDLYISIYETTQEPITAQKTQYLVP